MKWPVAMVVPMLLAGCSADRTERNVDALIEANLAKGDVLFTCRASSSGACHAVFLVDGHAVTAEATAGSAASASVEGANVEYCVDVTAPDPASCHPKTLVDGQQIVRSSTVTHKG